MQKPLEKFKKIFITARTTKTTKKQEKRWKKENLQKRIELAYKIIIRIGIVWKQSVLL